ncbi:MAG: hypothetical protein DRQ40_04050 [Gammaproteobacteria bacterium]|nr:MAG: hypothetical protein DRQ40_04050 [Gammaproteobacteria bacterium]
MKLVSMYSVRFKSPDTVFWVKFMHNGWEPSSSFCLGCLVDKRRALAFLQTPSLPVARAKGFLKITRDSRYSVWKVELNALKEWVGMSGMKRFAEEVMVEMGKVELDREVLAEAQRRLSVFSDTLLSEADMVPTDQVSVDQCVQDGTHLTSCDADGYCNYCGEQEGVCESRQSGAEMDLDRRCE